MYEVPVVLFVFNRPAYASRMIEALRALKPDVVYVVADGARKNRIGEQEKVDACRAAFSDLPWPCTVHRNYSSRNLGCMRRVSSGLDWVFSRESMAVILEDDCIPNDSFFRFCRGALDKYVDNDKVMSVSGSRLAPSADKSPDVLFSRYSYCWGWATWANRWEKFQRQISADAESLSLSFLRRKVGSLRAALYWRWLLQKVGDGSIDSWAYKWTYSHWLCDALSAVPRVNLISNIGAGQDATNTSDESRWLNRPMGQMSDPIDFPTEVHQATEFDQWIEDHVFSKSPSERIRWFFRRTS